MKKQLITLAALAGGFIIGASALVALAQTSTWSAPLHTPPTCLTGEPGCDAPINVGGSTQLKTGQLGLGHFQFVPPGMPTVGIAGKVLAATDDSGDVGWASPGGGIPNMAVFTSTGTWTAPSGVTKARVRLVGGGGAGVYSCSNSIVLGMGGSGGYAESVIPVSPGQTYMATVGGWGMPSPNNPVGGTSSFDSLRASGGSGGGCGGAIVNGQGTGQIVNLGGLINVADESQALAIYNAAYLNGMYGYGVGGLPGHSGTKGLVIIEY